MDLFINKIDGNKFRATNYIWNELKLNSPWSVGYISTLIENKQFTNKEEWKDYYFKSGNERLTRISELNPVQQSLVTNFSKKAWGVAKEVESLNCFYGRTEKELREKGKYMHEKILESGNPLEITIAECVYMVKYRVLGETWNGIIAREKNTVKTLQNIFKSICFEKCDGESDYKFGIDYELFYKEILLCAIQIKPISYKIGSSAEIMKAKKANEYKNAMYKEKFNKEVIYVYSNSKGNVLNDEAIAQIQQILDMNYFLECEIDYNQQVKNIA